MYTCMDLYFLLLDDNDRPQILGGCQRDLDRFTKIKAVLEAQSSETEDYTPERVSNQAEIVKVDDKIKYLDAIVKLLGYTEAEEAAEVRADIHAHPSDYGLTSAELAAEDAAVAAAGI